MGALRAAIAGHVAGAHGDIGALRTAFARVFTAFWMAYDKEHECYVVVPEARPDAYASEGWLRRVPVPLGTNNQHGTLLWKYMTQKTLRLS